MGCNVADLQRELAQAMVPTRIDGRSVNGIVLMAEAPDLQTCSCGKVMHELRDCLIVGFASKQDALPWLRGFVQGQTYQVQDKSGSHPAQYMGGRWTSMDDHSCLWLLRFELLDSVGKKTWPAPPPIP